MGKFGQVWASLSKFGQVRTRKIVTFETFMILKTLGNLREEETSRELQIAKKREYKLSGKEKEKVGSRIRRRLSAN